MKVFRPLLLFIVLGFLTSCKKRDFDPSWTKEQAPVTFTARFETTQGNFEIAVTRDYSPKAADRFYQLVKHGYFDNAMFYRVVKDFVAQFGNMDTLKMRQWRSVKIPDEPVRLSNTRGTVSFTQYGPNSRDLEVFINLEDNIALDTVVQQGVVGFPAFGHVVKGMGVVDKLYSGYGETSMGDPYLYVDRRKFHSRYPRLVVIKKAYLTR
jgi:peptidyl-prolyl cis-trans isomerase A (cyclophilin A)